MQDLNGKKLAIGELVQSLSRVGGDMKWIRGIITAISDRSPDVNTHAASVYLFSLRQHISQRSSNIKRLRPASMSDAHNHEIRLGDKVKFGRDFNAWGIVELITFDYDRNSFFAKIRRQDIVDGGNYTRYSDGLLAMEPRPLKATKPLFISLLKESMAGVIHSDGAKALQKRINDAVTNGYKLKGQEAEMFAALSANLQQGVTSA